MLSNHPTEPQAFPQGVKPGAAEPSCAPLNPRDTIEVVPQGNGTVNDPSASDTKPPGVAGADDYPLV